MASLSPYSITLGATDYPVKYAGLLAYIEPYLTNLETFTFSGGNVGLGVTPSAWGGGFRALQIYGRSSIASDNANRLWLNSDCYNNGTNWIYEASGVQVSQYQAWNGQHAWFTAPSGTAGNAITFTQAMTLAANARLGIGSAATTPAGFLHVSGAAGGATANDVYVERATGAGSANVGQNAWIQFWNTVDGKGSGIQTFDGGTIFWGWNGGWAERARITSGGNLLVGTTSATGSLTNNTKLVPGVLTSYNGTVSAANATAVTMFVVPTPSDGATFLVTVTLGSPDTGSTYTVLGLLRGASVTTSYTNIVTAASLTVSLSGTNLQVNQSSGLTQTVQWSLLRLV